MMATRVEVKKSPGRTPDVWHAFRSEMDQAFDRYAGSSHLSSWRRILKPDPAFQDVGFFAFFTPAVDVTEDDSAYKITAELPGLEDKNIDITMSGDVLTLKGEKHYERDEEDKNHHMSERGYGSFQRSFTLPDGINRDKIAAELSKGVLTITLPKTAEAQKPQKKIAIKAAA
jgi:HSP20 family protein